MPSIVSTIEKCGIRDLHWRRLLEDRYLIEVESAAQALARSPDSSDRIVYYYLGAYYFALSRAEAVTPDPAECRRWRAAPRLPELDGLFEEERARLVAGLGRRQVRLRE
jgi:hypothetical protein